MVIFYLKWQNHNIVELYDIFEAFKYTKKKCVAWPQVNFLCTFSKYKKKYYFGIEKHINCLGFKK
jgi:hypothetical protein